MTATAVSESRSASKSQTYDLVSQTERLKVILEKALEGRWLTEQLRESLWHCFCEMKQRHFSTESELRLVAKNDIGDEIQFEEDGGRIKPFLELAFSPVDVVEVWLGPGSSNASNRLFLEALLVKDGYSSKVQLSEIVGQ